MKKVTARMIWKEPWKVDLILVVCYEITKRDFSYRDEGAHLWSFPKCLLFLLSLDDYLVLILWLQAALMIFVLDTAIGLGIWIPFTVGKATALLSVSRASSVIPDDIKGFNAVGSTSILTSYTSTYPRHASHYRSYRRFSCLCLCQTLVSPSGKRGSSCIAFLHVFYSKVCSSTSWKQYNLRHF
jgi:hypothetical protein